MVTNVLSERFPGWTRCFCVFLAGAAVFACLLLSSHLRTATKPNLGANKDPQLHQDWITEMLLL